MFPDRDLGTCGGTDLIDSIARRTDNGANTLVGKEERKHGVSSCNASPRNEGARACVQDSRGVFYFLLRQQLGIERHYKRLGVAVRANQCGRILERIREIRHPMGIFIHPSDSRIQNEDALHKQVERLRNAQAVTLKGDEALVVEIDHFIVNRNLCIGELSHMLNCNSTLADDKRNDRGRDVHFHEKPVVHLEVRKAKELNFSVPSVLDI